MNSVFHPSKQQTLLITGTGPDHDPGRAHLHIILTNQCAEKSHLLVSVRSRHPRCDTTCLLGVGDHKFFTKDSYVSYSQARIWSTDDIMKKVTNGDITYRGLIDPKIFALIAMGVENSLFMKPKLKKYYQENKAN